MPPASFDEPADPRIERRALELFEQLADDPGDADLRNRVLAVEPERIRRRLEALQRKDAAAAKALPTLISPEVDDVDDQPPPERVGAFRLVRRIGTGGMGEVWLGERADGLFDQQVAVKLMRRRALARAAVAFEEERRFLAKLEHSGVARLIDGGVCDDGIPWLAMEYVDGRTLDEAAGGRPLIERVRLVHAAALVVQAAHAKLIAHGDIKPDNVLVDAAGQVKLLDFGVARLIDGPEAAPLSACTPAFTSPERLKGEGVSVGDDVYALGCTLAAIVADDADHELQAVIAKAIASGDRRYPGVAAFAADLQRWSEQRPVSALPPHLTYRTRKYVARHAVAVAASCLALLLLGATILAANHFYHRAQRERVAATSRFADAKRAAHYLMFDLADRLERMPGTLAMRAQIGQVAEGYLSRLARSPDAPFDVKLDALEGYLRVAATTGIGNAPNLADIARAQSSLATAKRLLHDLATSPRHRTALVVPAVRVTAFECQAKIYGEHDAARAWQIARNGVAMARGLDPGAADRATLWPLRICEGDALVWLDRPEQAVRLLESELADARARRPTADPITLARNLRFLGEALFYAGRYSQAAGVLEEAQTLLGREHRSAPFRQVTINEYASVADDLASTRKMQGRHADALVVAESAYLMVRKQAALDPNDLQSQRRALSLARIVAGSLAKLGKADQAVALMDGVGAQWNQLAKRYPDDAALARLRNISLSIRGDLSRAAGDRERGCAFYRQALEQWAVFGRRWMISPSDTSEVIATTRGDAAACMGQGHFVDN